MTTQTAVTTPIAGAASVTIDASAEDIYACLTDVANLGRLSPECIRAEWDTPTTAAAVGATFTGHNQLHGMRWMTTNEVLSAEPGRSFAFVSGFGNEKATRWRYDIEPIGTGTRVTESFEMIEMPMFLRDRTPEELTVRAAELRTGVEATLARLKAAVEARPTLLAPGDGTTLPGMPSVTFKDVPAARDRQFVAMEIVMADVGGGPPPHRHLYDSECFYVLEGRVWFEIDSERITLGVGGFALAPAGCFHSFGNIGPEPARLLAVTTPRSADFLWELQALIAGAAPEAEVDALHARYDIELLS